VQARTAQLRNLNERVEPPLALAIGDVVVYASHGIGRVTTRRAGDGELGEAVVLEFDGGLTVTLPIDQAQLSLRPLADELELACVQRTLSGDQSREAQPWSKRFRAIQQKVSAGDVAGLAEVVRDGIHRERQVALRSGMTASPSERHLYLKARRLLADEIALARGIDSADADIWIVEQIGATV
jgi:RNA polymerase-interacting CarD/CdnL/TRCF family regulator